MSNRISEEEFYRRREDRTRSLTPNLHYQREPLAISASEVTAQTHSGQVMLCTATNLFARWGRAITVNVPDCALVPQMRRAGCTNLHQRIAAEIYEANPFCRLRFLSPVDGVLHLCIGVPPADIECDYVSAVDGWDALGWRQGVDQAPNISARSTPFIPASQLSATLGAAALFKLAIRLQDENHFGSYRWNLWNHSVRGACRPASEGPGVPDCHHELGQILQVGVGAVGSNVLYFLSVLDAKYEIVLVDDDTVKIENLDRSLLFGIQDALPEQQKKVAAAKQALSKLGVGEITTYPMRWGQYVDEHLSQNSSDAWLALANDDGAWQSMAENLPPLVLHGTTSSDWGIFLGRHIPFLDYCLRCRFQPNDTHQSVCGAGEVQVRSEDGKASARVDASLPFLSAAAAALVVGELLKLNTGGYPSSPNYVEANLLGKIEPIAIHRKPVANCSACRHTSRNLWVSLRGDSKYSHLTSAVLDQ